MPSIKIGIITASDRASAGVYEDLSGQAIIDTLNDYLSSEWEPVYRLIPDDQHVVEEALIEMYLAGVSVRRVEDITQALWGTRVSSGTVSNLNKKIYERIERWRNRPI